MKIDVRVNKLLDTERPIKAFVSITLDDKYAVHGVKVVQGKERLLVSMPSHTFRTRDGTLIHRDVAHPISTEVRSEVDAAVMTAYMEALAAAEEETQSE